MEPTMESRVWNWTAGWGQSTRCSRAANYARMAAVKISTEPDPPPIVRILATTLRRAAEHPQIARTLGGMRGVAALRSSTDPQCATMRFDRGTIVVDRGVADDVMVVIATDLATMNDPNPPKPQVSGALRHPAFALALAKVLAPPNDTWSDGAQRFWTATATHPGMPPAIEIVDTDTGERLLLGGGEPRVEVHGATHWLTVLFSGNSILGEEILAGRIRFVGALEHLAVLTGRTIAGMLDGASES